MASDVNLRVAQYLAHAAYKGRIDHGQQDAMEDALIAVLDVVGPASPVGRIAVDALIRAGGYKGKGQRVAFLAVGLPWCDACEYPQHACMCEYYAREKAKREAEALKKAEAAIPAEPAHAA